MRHLPRLAAIGAVLTLAACGTNPGDRAVGGAVGGALIGGGIGALGGPIGAGVGAAVGGGAGAMLGAFTTPEQVDLGAPPWSDPTVRTPQQSAPAAPPRS
jgi:osmotically inducible lipoprotein OsmB